MTKDELALFIYEQCQDRTAPLAAIVQAVADKAGVSPESIDSLVRKYKNSGTGLEETASKVLGAGVDGSQIVVPQVSILSPAQAIITPASNFTIHNGIVVSLEQEQTKLNVIDSTVPELKGLPLSQNYFETRIKQLFGDVSYDLKNLAESLNNRGKVLDLALVEALPKPEQCGTRQAFLYDGIKYSGWKMQTDEEIRQEEFIAAKAREEQQARKEQRLQEEHNLIESLGLNKFDEPEKCYQLYCVLKENNEDFSFDINLLSEEGCGNIFYYDSEEYKIIDDSELTDQYYESEVEYLIANPHDYVCDACTSDMIEHLYGYTAETFKSDDGNYHIIKE